MAIQATCPACGGTVQANDEQELMQKVADHAKNDHSMTEIPEDVAKAVKASVKKV